MPTIINGLEVISSLLDKAKLDAMDFASNSTLDNQYHPLTDSSTSHKVKSFLLIYFLKERSFSGKNQCKVITEFFFQ